MSVFLTQTHSLVVAQSEVMLVTRACAGDPARTARVLGLAHPLLAGLGVPRFKEDAETRGFRTVGGIQDRTDWGALENARSG